MSAKKKALGRGLGALIDIDETVDTEEIIEKRNENSSAPISEVKLADIETNPFQPRTEFDQEALEELSNSIKELGIIQPVTLRELGDGKYQLISGERRMRASLMAGKETITAYVRKANDTEMLEMALVENIQREDLDSIEVAISYQRLLDECQLTQEVLSTRVGKKRSTVTNYLRLLKLPAEVQLAIRNRKISMGHARALVSLDAKEDQVDVLFRIIEEELSVRKTEEIIRNWGKVVETKEEEVVQPDDQQYIELKSHLSNYFKTDVDFKINNKGRGKIVISFKSNPELERIIGMFDTIQ